MELQACEETMRHLVRSTAQQENLTGITRRVPTPHAGHCSQDCRALSPPRSQSVLREENDVLRTLGQVGALVAGLLLAHALVRATVALMLRGDVLPSLLGRDAGRAVLLLVLGGLLCAAVCVLRAFTSPLAARVTLTQQGWEVGAVEDRPPEAPVVTTRTEATHDGQPIALPGYLCEQCLDAPAVALVVAPWGGEMGICSACVGALPHQED